MTFFESLNIKTYHFFFTKEHFAKYYTQVNLQVFSQGCFEFFICLWIMKDGGMFTIDLLKDCYNKNSWDHLTNTDRRHPSTKQMTNPFSLVDQLNEDPS